jgi:hypothetical protein
VNQFTKRPRNSSPLLGRRFTAKSTAAVGPTKANPAATAAERKDEEKLDSAKVLH